jgi:molybdopterin-guanine dinucleotide biosynthesis protein A
VEIATTIIVCGDCTVALGDHARTASPAITSCRPSSRRKQAFVAHADTWLTMVFATLGQSVEEAEDEFTAEAERLMSRQVGHANTIIVTGF